MKNFKKYFSFVLVFLFLIFLYIFSIKNDNFGSRASEKDISTCQTCGKEIKYIEIAGKKIKVEEVSDDISRERGLSGRLEMKNDEGMLFVFPESGKYFFWMKEMNFPIDIIWLNENFEIIYIKKDAQPASYPEAFGPSIPSRYVLEVNAGFSEKNNLKIGEKVNFLP